MELIIKPMCIFWWKMHTLHKQHTLKPQGHVWSKGALNEMFVEFNFKSVLFYGEMLNSKICIWPPLDEHVCGYLSPSEKLQNKISPLTKKFLEFNFGRVFLCQKSRILNFYKLKFSRAQFWCFQKSMSYPSRKNSGRR